MALDIEPITPGIGAEISGLNLAEPLGDDRVLALREAFLRHLVLVFRDQSLTRNQHKQFGRYFGELHVHPSHRSGMNKTGDPEIFVVDTPADAKQSNGEAWHSDVSCEENPPMASLLYVTTVPENGGGDTLFANMYDAYDELSKDMKQLLLGRTAWHDGEIDLRNYGIRQRLPDTQRPWRA